uniref:G-protein coupled receptors family 1 profile domain-containing protein n=1 Tax=Nothoprocta perdicaria TaxID=30464 RepID=A0A8C6ZYI4_NOTPE
MENFSSSPSPFSASSAAELPGNGTVHDHDSGLQRSMHVLSMVVYSVACLLGVTGNGLVIWIAGFKMKKTVNSVWFLNLAIADFIFTFFLPLSIAYTALGFHWPFGKLLCKLNSTMAFLNMFASVFLLTVISMDRCVAVAFPVWSRNRRSPELAARVALGTWVLALLLSSPYLVFRDTAVGSRNVTSCYNNFALSDDYTSERTLVFPYASTRFCSITLGKVAHKTTANSSSVNRKWLQNAQILQD